MMLYKEVINRGGKLVFGLAKDETFRARTVMSDNAERRYVNVRI